jgi:two-component system, NtrC family, C4-dicarboxylate transport sensor histidine kinase DctB
MQLTDAQKTDSGGSAESPAPVDIRANRYDVLSRLADDLAHEIKNPLNAVVVNLEVLRRRIEKGATEAALERTGVIEHEVRRVHRLVEELLQLLRPAKLESGPIAVDAIIDSLSGSLHLQAKAVHVPLDWECESSLYAQVHSAPLKFALLNLLNYAIDAEAEAGGAISVRAHRTADEVYIVVSCSRAQLATDSQHIYYCRELIQTAGGTLESVAPQHGGGSTVTLMVPPGRFGGPDKNRTQIE